MNNVFTYLLQGGMVMWPLMALSVATFACALDRAVFWVPLLSQERRIVHDVLDAAHISLEEAANVAEKARHLPIGRFLLAPLRLRRPSPETFRLAQESVADRELVQMRKGDKFLETVVAVAPLLGLLGTVTGLILTFGNLDIGGGGSTDSASKAAAGIGEALISTAAGMVVAIIALLFNRIFVTLQDQQMDYFAEVGSQLELIYRQVWYESDQPPQVLSQPIPPSNEVESSSRA